MLARTFKYTDYDGNEREETCYFNLNEAEIMELNLSVNGGFEAMIRRAINAQDGARLMETFKDIIMRSYGEKSLDGKRFHKSKELSEAFTQTEMYNQLFMELIYDADKAAEFMNAIAPKPKQDKKTDFVPGPLPTQKNDVVAEVTPMPQAGGASIVT